MRGSIVLALVSLALSACPPSQRLSTEGARRLFLSQWGEEERQIHEICATLRVREDEAFGGDVQRLLAGSAPAFRRELSSEVVYKLGLLAGVLGPEVQRDCAQVFPLLTVGQPASEPSRKACREALASGLSREKGQRLSMAFERSGRRLSADE